MTKVPLTKVPLNGSWPKPGSLVMVSVEIGPTDLMAPAKV